MDTKVADPLRGALLAGRYRVLGRLARGGMANVYHARDERLERNVAIKIIHPDRARDPRFMRRFTDEAKTVASLTHPNVVAVFDQGTYEDSPYLVMEFVRGRTLREILTERRRLDPAESLAVLEQMLAALAVAHRAGLVHRDVKPENILVAPPPSGSGDLVDAVVKVADFGLARPAEVPARDADGQLLATAEYVAPELVTDGTGDARADVYSAGVVLFEMLTGRVPFEGDRPEQIAWQHVERDVPAPSKVVPGLPSLVDDVVARATARDPAGRPRDAGAMLAEVQAAREDVGALAGPTRALAHPTVVVTPVHSRPAWARLPESRGASSAGVRHGGGLGPGGRLNGAWASLRRRLGRVGSSRKSQRSLIAVMVVIGLALVAGGWWFGYGRYTNAPSLTQLTHENAVKEAGRLGFDVELGAGRYAEDIPKDTVVDQQPGPGNRIVKGGTITLVLSLGPERYPVPEVAGQAADFAKAQLSEHFVVEVEEGFSDSLPLNFVVSTDPPAGTQLPPSSKVKLVVVKGKYPVHVPGVVGKLLGEADQILRSNGFTEIEVQRRDDESKPRDTVLEQNPAEGTGLKTAEGTKVVIVVANGPPGPPMPSVLTVKCSDAINHLRGLGYNVNANGNPVEQFFWTVLAQDPQPGTPTQPGQTVTLQCG
jgi:eukaryotic-like serine/threonine-protein kinase